MSGRPILSAKERAFVAAYPVSLCAAKAARKAGYTAKYAGTQGKQLMRRPHVREAIQKAMAARYRSYKADADSVIAELRRLAFYDTTMFMQIIDGQLIVQDTDLLPEDLRRCITEISQTQHGLRIKFADKVKALELLGRHLALFHDSLNLSGEVKTSEIEKMTDEDLDAELAAHQAPAGGEAPPASP